MFVSLCLFFYLSGDVSCRILFRSALLMAKWSLALCTPQVALPVVAVAAVAAVAAAAVVAAAVATAACMQPFCSRP